MSFALTTAQVLARTKTVTRRMGWRTLKPGTLISGVRKCQGLKKGEKIERLCVIRIVDVRREPLRRMCDTKYGFSECAKEGFPDMLPDRFVEWFAESHGCEIGDDVTRIEFEYA